MTLVLNGTTGVSAVDGSASTPAIQGNDTNTGVFFPAADTVAVATGGSERMRVDSSGNVGVGTSSPTNNLQVEGKASAYAVALVKSNGGAGNGYGASFQLTNTNGDNYQIRIADSGSGSTYQQALDFLTISAPSGKGLRFSTNGAESARIDSSGKFLVATTSSTSVGSFTGSTNVSTFNQSGITLTQYSVSAGFYYDRLNFTNSQYFVVNSGGTGVYLGNGSTAWSAYSDIRLKNVTGTYTNALADVAKLQPIKFTWKSDESAKPCVGLSAQSVQQVVPEAVDSTRLPGGDDETEYLSVRYQEVIPLLTAAIQELKAELDSVKAEIATLKGAQA